MKQILIIEKGSLSAADKGKLTKSGYILIETDNPDKVKLIQPEINELRRDSFVMSALAALAQSVTDKPREVFIKELYNRMIKQEQDETNTQRG